MNNRTKVIKNLFFGFLSQILSIIFSLVIPRLFLLNYGSETNGLMSSIGQVFAYLTLLETGVGWATVQDLYMSIGLNDKQAISSTLSAISRYYKKLAVYIVWEYCYLL